MDDLVTWLRAQLAEDERGATLASAALGGHGAFDASGSRTWHDVDGMCPEEFEHIARHDPARVLREVEVKRQLTAELERLPHYAWDGRDEYGCPKHTDLEVWRYVYGDDVEQTCNCGRDDHVSRTLRLMALPYADHPGYRAEWAPAVG